MRSRGEQIAGRLREEILTGRLPAGAVLRELELARRFEASRGPVREALLELIDEGLLVALARGARVAPPAPDDIQKLVGPIRRTIESYALRLFFPSVTAADFAAWEAILGRMKSACERGDVAAIAEQDIALHRSFLERSGQPDLLAIWSTVVGRMRRHVFINVESYSDLMVLYQEHVDLIDTFRTGEVRAAVRALKDHIWRGAGSHRPAGNGAAGPAIGRRRAPRSG